jgi:hypothetical protein
MFRLIRKLIILLLLLAATVAFLIFRGIYSPVGFIDSASFRDNTLLLGRVVAHAKFYYCIEDPSGSIWVFNESPDDLPPEGSLVLVWSTFSTSAESKAHLPIQIWRVGTF